MIIKINQYEREDGVTLHRDPNGWMIRKILGPSWFYNPKTSYWVISTSDKFLFNQFDFIIKEFETAFKLLETISRDE